MVSAAAMLTLAWGTRAGESRTSVASSISRQ